MASSAREQSIEKTERTRLGYVMLAAIFLLWVVPMLAGNIAIGHNKSTPLTRFYGAGGWVLLYGVSLFAWRLPEWLFCPRPWEIHGQIYERVGVRWFKQFMVEGDRQNRRVRRHLKSYRVFAKADTRRLLIQWTIATEKAHVIMFLVALWPTLFGAVEGFWKYAVFMAASNIVTNVYPIMLQRYTRSRITGIALRKA
jgi:hypothetical protein